MNIKTVILHMLYLTSWPVALFCSDMDEPTDMRGRADEVFADSRVRSLAEAAERGNVRDMERLLTQGVDVNAAGRFGITPADSRISLKVGLI